MDFWILTIISVIIISLLIIIIFLQIQNRSNKDKDQESIKELDRALLKQEDTLLDLTKDIQSFHDPLNKLPTTDMIKLFNSFLIMKYLFL